MSPAAAADLKVDSNRVQQGGGDFWIVEYEAAKDPYQPHASLDANAAASATTLSCYHALASGELNIPVQFGSTGTLDIDIFAQDAAAEEKAFSALATNDFTVTAITTARTAGAVVKLKDTDDYTVTHWKNLGNLSGTTPLSDKTPSNNVFNEKGDKTGAFDGDRDVKVLTVLQQTGKSEIDFVTKESRGKHYAAKYVKDMGVLGKQIFVWRKLKLITDVEMARKQATTGEIGITFEVITDGANEPYVVYEG